MKYSPSDNMKPMDSHRDVAMLLLVVSGFLGNGKTTFIIQMAREVLRKKANVAILVNEIGVDD
jgi:Ni2+-binding GTPase involved in maturation of urease and hydrogenase